MVLIHVGVTSVIAHIKIGHMHAALESKVLVVSAQGQCAANTSSVPICYYAQLLLLLKAHPCGEHQTLDCNNFCTLFF